MGRTLIDKQVFITGSEKQETILETRRALLGVNWQHDFGLKFPAEWRGHPFPQRLVCLRIARCVWTRLHTNLRVSERGTRTN